jgi:hypothetical protein
LWAGGGDERERECERRSAVGRDEKVNRLMMEKWEIQFLGVLTIFFLASVVLMVFYVRCV